MAGQSEADLCKVIIEEKFGTAVSLVMAQILREPGYFGGIVLGLRSQMKASLIRKSMAVLEQFNILKFKLDINMKVTYWIDVESITALLKAPRCNLLIRKIHGELADNIFLQIFYNGRLTCSDVIRKCIITADQQLDVKQVRNEFARLAESQDIIRCSQVQDRKHECPEFFNPEKDLFNRELFTVPTKLADDLNKLHEVKTTKKRKAGEADPDADIVWRINFSRFDRYFRDEIITDLVAPRNWTGDAKSSEVCKQTLIALLRASELRKPNIALTSSAPISFFDIVKSSSDFSQGLDKLDIDWALRTLVEDARGIIRKAGDSSGGLYVIDFERAIRLSCQQHIESLIREQLGTKAVRVFRLLQMKGFLEEEQVEKMTMMNAKETRELLFGLQEEGYVFTKPIGKTQDFAPARTFYLYYIDLTKTVRGILEYTCKSLRNIILRRRKEFLDNKYLVDKNDKMQNIIGEIQMSEHKDLEAKQAEEAAVRETYMPPADAAKFEKFEKSRNMLGKAEAEIERVLMTLRLHLLLSKPVVQV